MANTYQSWSPNGGASPSVETAITSAADLATGNTLVSASIDNTLNSGLGGAGVGPISLLWADFELYLPNGVGSALTVEQPVELYIIPALDGTNFADFDANFTDILAPQNCFAGSFMVRAEATASTSQRLFMKSIELPPLKFKALIRNVTGQSLKDGATHFTVRFQRKSFQFG